MHNILVLDVENTIHVSHHTNRDGKRDTIKQMGPFHPDNKLVSIGLGTNTDNVHDTEYYCFHHNERPLDEGAFEKVQEHLDKADLLIGHNLKHDLHWLRACGFKYSGKMWDTQIAEYVLCRSAKKPLALKFVAERYGAPAKKSDIIDQYMKDGIMFDAIPWDIVEEYGRGDITTTMAVYLKQQEMFSLAIHKGLLPTVRMMCDFLECVEEMEYNGLTINFDALNTVEKDYLDEFVILEQRLTELASEVMGDTPIRLSSNDFMSELIYSRKVKDKNAWKKVFNIGTDASGKKLRRPTMAKSRFTGTVRKLTTVIKRTEVQHCHDCKGKGHYYKLKVDGNQWKKPTTCPSCGGAGVIYKDTGKIGGFKLLPKGVKWTSSSGFAADKDTIEMLLETAPDNAVEFLKKMVRFNAVKTYLSTFVDGINKHTGVDGMLHTSLNQTVTATARLSSSAPNFQNQPRGGTFPVRKVIISRFKGGKLLEFDYAQLEFRIAGYLSKCPELRQFVEEGNDAHAFSRDTINEFDPSLPKVDRQDSKPHTFKPLYGGMSGAPREKHYYKMFLEKFSGVAQWHEELKQYAIRDKIITLPSGRQYAFPYAKRQGSGYVNGTTQIVNYPVQGFATADITPLGIIRVLQLMKKAKVRSLLVLTVHDSILVDVYPGEEEIMIGIMRDGLLDIPNLCKEYYGIDFDFPIEVEAKMGNNWLETDEVGVFTNA